MSLLSGRYRLADEDTSVATDVWNYPKNLGVGSAAASAGATVYG